MRKAGFCLLGLCLSGALFWGTLHWSAQIAGQKREAFVARFLQSAYANDDFYKSFQSRGYCDRERVDAARQLMTKSYVIDHDDVLFSSHEISLHYSNGVAATLDVIQPEWEITGASLSILALPAQMNMDYRKCRMPIGAPGVLSRPRPADRFGA